MENAAVVEDAVGAMSAEVDPNKHCMPDKNQKKHITGSADEQQHSESEPGESDSGGSSSSTGEEGEDHHMATSIMSSDENDRDVEEDEGDLASAQIVQTSPTSASANAQTLRASSSTVEEDEDHHMTTSIMSSDENDGDVEEDEGDLASAQIVQTSPTSASANAQTVRPSKKILRRKKKPKKVLTSALAAPSSKGVRFASIIATSSDGESARADNDNGTNDEQNQNSKNEGHKAACAFTVEEDDSEKTLSELQHAIFDLRQHMNVMKVDLSAEKALRRSKEKNLVKMAKHLNGKVEEMEEMDRLMSEVSDFLLMALHLLPISAGSSHIYNCLLLCDTDATRNY
jgi:hypothetical protein